MKCEEAVEFVSALCDGQTIPPAAAEHIGACQTCHARLKEYVEMGAELRRIASLESVGEVRTLLWDKTQRTTQNWWQKGWETMRIPRFAFALLIVAVVALGSSLTLVRVRAQGQGEAKVLVLTAKTSKGGGLRCPLSLQDPKMNSCGSSGPDYELSVRVVSSHGHQIELGFRARAVGTPSDTASWTPAFEGIDRIPEKLYVLHPGQDLHIDLPESGHMVVSGELFDHMPSWLAWAGDVDPKPGVLQVLSPVLIRGKEVLYDMQGMGLTTDPQFACEMDLPGSGRWIFSLQPMEGAVEGKVGDNRVSFVLEGQSYTLIAGAPIARTEQQIWVLHDGSYRPPEGLAGHAFLGETSRGQAPVK